MIETFDLTDFPIMGEYLHQKGVSRATDLDPVQVGARYKGRVLASSLHLSGGGFPKPKFPMEGLDVCSGVRKNSSPVLLGVDHKAFWFNASGEGRLHRAYRTKIAKADEGALEERNAQTGGN